MSDGITCRVIFGPERFKCVTCGNEATKDLKHSRYTLGGYVCRDADACLNRVRAEVVKATTLRRDEG